jgi:hypothetical protein
MPNVITVLMITKLSWMQYCVVQLLFVILFV